MRFFLSLICLLFILLSSQEAQAPLPFQSIEARRTDGRNIPVQASDDSALVVSDQTEGIISVDTTTVSTTYDSSGTNYDPPMHHVEICNLDTLVDVHVCINDSTSDPIILKPEWSFAFNTKRYEIRCVWKKAASGSALVNTIATRH